MSLIRDSLKKIQEKEDAADKTVATGTAPAKTGGGPKGSRTTYILLGVGVALIVAVYFLLFQVSPQRPSQPKLAKEGQGRPASPPSAAGTAPAPATAGTTAGSQESKAGTPKGTLPSPAAKTEGAAGVRPPTLATIPPSRAVVGKDGGNELLAVKTGTSSGALLERTAPKGPAGQAAIPAPPKDKAFKPTEAKSTAAATSPASGRGIETDIPAQEQLKKAYDQAYNWQQEGKVELAQARYREILAQDPYNPYVLTNLGLLYQKNGQLREAVQSFEKAIEADPRFGPAVQNLGMVWIRLGNNDEAGRWLERSLALDPDNAVALANLGIVAKKKGNRDLARQYWKKSLIHNPRLSEVCYNLARLEEESGNIPEAFRYYQQFIRLRNDPTDRLVLEVQGHIRDWKLPN